MRGFSIIIPQHEEYQNNHYSIEFVDYKIRKRLKLSFGLKVKDLRKHFTHRSTIREARLKNVLKRSVGCVPT
jgi:hypothetical protein